MLRTLTLFPLFALLMAFSTHAQVSNTQSLGGRYKLDNPKVNADVVIVPLWGTPCYAGIVSVNGTMNPGETMGICPDANNKGTYNWNNNKGGAGTVTQDANGDLTVTVTEGSNKGKVTKWKKQ